MKFEHSLFLSKFRLQDLNKNLYDNLHDIICSEFMNLHEHFHKKFLQFLLANLYTNLLKFCDSSDKICIRKFKEFLYKKFVKDSQLYEIMILTCLRFVYSVNLYKKIIRNLCKIHKVV